jgi:hypothetical protein
LKHPKGYQVFFPHQINKSYRCLTRCFHFVVLHHAAADINHHQRDNRGGIDGLKIEDLNLIIIFRDMEIWSPVSPATFLPFDVKDSHIERHRWKLASINLRNFDRVNLLLYLSVACKVAELRTNTTNRLANIALMNSAHLSLLSIPQVDKIQQQLHIIHICISELRISNGSHRIE